MACDGRYDGAWFRFRIKRLPGNDRLTIDDWLLAEAVCLNEERQGRRRDDGSAVAIARTAGGRLGHRIAARAGALDGAGAMRADIARLRRMMRNAAVGLVVVGLIAGALAARGAIAERQVDILLAASALLVVPTLMLLVWAFLMMAGTARSGSPSLAGSILVAGLRWLGPKLLTSPQAADLTLAGGRLMQTGFGRWFLSTLTHGFWLAYGIGALATLALYFSIVQYDLTWGTTLLADETVIALVESLARAPGALGLMPEPDSAWIVAGREGALEAAGRSAWARFLLAMLVVYGLLPRAVLGIVSTVAARFGARRLTLDTDRPGYLRLAADLAPDRVEAAMGEPPPKDRKAPRRPRPAHAGLPVTIGLELERAVDAWPSELPGVESRDLGRADDRDSRLAVEQAIGNLKKPPAAILAVCSMLRTPDAGTARWLDRLGELAGAPVVIVLDEVGRLEERGVALKHRLADWEALADRIGGDCVMLDLDKPDAAAVARLHQLVHGDGERS